MLKSVVVVVVAVAGCSSTTESTLSEPLTVSTCVTFQRGHGTDAVADTYLKPNALTKNFGAKPALRVSASDEALIRFELASIPSNATIMRATLRLFANGEAGDGTIRLHRVTSAWTEGSVTYASFRQAFAPDPVGGLRVESRTTQKSVDLTSVVSGWVHGTYPNAGLELDVATDHHAARDHESDDDGDPTLFVSSEGPAARRPALEVCYSVFVDECAASPCHNGGTCTNGSAGYTCACAPGFAGTTCDTVIDHCAAAPCQHGGGCTNTADGYTCACPAGFAGANCETDIDDCAAQPCQHGGVCTDGVASYTCACAPGYDGASCEHAIDGCANDPCHNGGSCASVGTGFTCACATGFTGSTCDTNIDDCTGNPCVNGTCVDGIASFTCACAPDWGGARCDLNLDTCAQAPCLNGGTCTNGVGVYTCACASGYTGANCEVDIDDCATNPCQNGGMCVDGVASHTCMCAAGYSGASCELLPPPLQVRIDGTCMAICQTASDPDGDGWGFESGTTCVMPTNPRATSSPWCDSPIPQDAYEPPAAAVDDTTTSVATIPRPPRIAVGAPTSCPYLAPGLVPLNPAWVVNGGDLTIPPNTRVLVHGNQEISATTLIRRLYVPATSELVFADEPATIHVTDLVVDGALRLGSATCRLESAIQVEFDTDEDVGAAAVRQTIYNRMGLGLMVGPNGVLDLFGHLYQPTWTRLAATAAVGATQLSLAEPVDWQPGQQIVVATSARVDYPYLDQNEVRTIVAASGTSVTLDRALTYPHYGGPEYQVEVGLLSRNLQFHTSARVVAAAPTFGGHIMVHSKLAHVSGVELYGLGQQNFLARYPFHWHRAGDVGGASFFTDSSVWHSNWRCAVIHRTDRAIVSRNVAYDNFGHCYYLEDGLEMNNEVSFNLAVRTKIMGPVDETSLGMLRSGGQPGFTLAQSPDLVQPADRAAAGFYITNGNNQIVGNASSGGFTGYSLPNLPQAIGGSPERIFPILYGASHFDGNTAHSTGYLWSEGGAGIYIGGTLVEIGGQLQYTSGRSTDWDLLRHRTEVFSNTKTFLCEAGIVHWGSNPRIVNFEAWDDGILARLFGAASIQSSLVVGATGNVLPELHHLANGNSIFDLNRPLSWWHRGFQFYDTRTQTILRDVAFRNFHHDPAANGPLQEQDHCALLSMTHSDQYTPQRMNAVAGLHFVGVDDGQRLCISNRGTLSSRNFNVIDADGSLSSVPGDTVPAGPRIVASAWASSWQLSSECAPHAAWGAVVCPLRAPQNVASIGTIPDADVHVTMYGLDNTSLGENWYSSTEFVDAQITGPSGVGWHHAFPGGVPATVGVQSLQVPDASFVLLSFTLPPGVACAVHDAGWSAVADLPALLAATTPVYTTAQSTCFVRVPPTDVGDFVASGLAIPNMTWRGNPTPTTYFTIDTGCSAANPACAAVISRVPILP